MAQINLLPWREERRDELKKAFLVVLAMFALAAIALVFVYGMFVKGQIENQQERNRYLTSEIDALTKQVSEIEQLEQRREALLDRMKIIQDLQGNRPIIVRVFDELVRTVPDGLYYTELKRANNAVQIKGVAESNARVSSLMRQMDGSEWFGNPNLTGVKSNEEFGEVANDFELSVNILTPGVGVDADADGVAN